MLKAVARDKRRRFETAEEFLLALERGASRPLSAPQLTPLMQRGPTALWKVGRTAETGFDNTHRSQIGYGVFVIIVLLYDHSENAFGHLATT